MEDLLHLAPIAMKAILSSLSSGRRASAARVGASVVGAAALVGCLVGCGERDPYNAYDVDAAHRFHAQQEAEALRHAPRDPNTSGGRPVVASGEQQVRCRCDADGGLHVQAPQSAEVRVPADAAREDAEAEITLAEQPRGLPLRQTKSLGFVGDGPLTQTPSRGGPWNAPDAVLPPHQHHEPHYPPVFTYGGGYGYGPAYGYGYGGYARGRGGPRGGVPANGGGPAPALAPIAGPPTPHIRDSAGVNDVRGGSAPAPRAPIGGREPR